MSELQRTTIQLPKELHKRLKGIALGENITLAKLVTDTMEIRSRRTDTKRESKKGGLK